jgi:hypothetical protein
MSLKSGRQPLGSYAKNPSTIVQKMNSEPNENHEKRIILVIRIDF